MTKIEVVLARCRADEGPASADLSRTVSSVSRTRCQILSVAIRRCTLGRPAAQRQLFEAAVLLSFGPLAPAAFLGNDAGARLRPAACSAFHPRGTMPLCETDSGLAGVGERRGGFEHLFETSDGLARDGLYRRHRPAEGS